jgi:hypothetical protein
VIAPLFVAACNRDDTDTLRVSTSSRDRSDATFSRRDTTRRLGPGDVLITNSDSSVELGIIGDSIVTGLSSKVMDQVRDKTDTTKPNASDGIGASIEKFVKSTVASALGTQIKYAVADVRDARYSNGKIELFWKDGSQMRLFENTKQNGKPMSETFRADEAARFVAAFQSKKAALGR